MSYIFLQELEGEYSVGFSQDIPPCALSRLTRSGGNSMATFSKTIYHGLRQWQ